MHKFKNTANGLEIKMCVNKSTRKETIYSVLRTVMQNLDLELKPEYTDTLGQP